MKSEDIVLIALGLTVAGVAAWKFGLVDRLRASLPAAPGGGQVPHNPLVQQLTPGGVVTGGNEVVTQVLMPDGQQVLVPNKPLQRETSPTRDAELSIINRLLNRTTTTPMVLQPSYTQPDGTQALRGLLL